MNIDRKIWTVYGKYQRKGLYKENKKRLSLREKRIGSKRYNELKSYFENLYHDKEYGIKSLAKTHNMTPSNMRGLLEFLKIDLRSGRNVVTNRVKRLRSEKAILESKEKRGFNDPTLCRKYEGISRGVQGYYYNKSSKDYVWLRSTWEFIFAKWLDRTNHNWKVEETYFNLENRIYRPDFFIYDENWNNLVKIIEVKGYWDNNSDKAKLLKDKLKNVEIVVIKDINKFIEDNKTYHQELRIWKKERKTKCPR